ncbi:helix-turn-helix domain-containing protein [Ammonifex degensii]|uniref:helix-turn-helix domain-containing protein n=1 Tax=Ammonifex degensii TaxID=42838 RepID=UPI00059E798F|nr:helix-turn-helix transcriptional regulator [Ammonifex degensii]
MALTRIKIYRVRKGLTCTELAGRLGCSRAYLSVVENGTVRAGKAFRSRLAEALGCEERGGFARRAVCAWRRRR